MRRSNSSNIGRLLLNGKYSDLLLRCNGIELRAHRAIVCTQSAWFDRACSGAFQDDYERIIDFPDERPEILYKVLEFLYTEDVKDVDFFDNGQIITRGPSNSSTSSSSNRSIAGGGGGLGFQLAIAGLPPDEHDHSYSPQYHNNQPLRRHHSVLTTRRPSTWTPSPVTPSFVPPTYTPSPPPAVSPMPATATTTTTTTTTTGAFLTSPWNEWAHLQQSGAGSDGNVAAAEDEGQDAVATLYTYLRLYVAAGRYTIPQLGGLALDRFSRIVRGHWMTVAYWASDHRTRDLLAELFDTTVEWPGDKLRKLVYELVAGCYRDCRGNLRDVMLRFPEFAVAVLDRLAGFEDGDDDRHGIEDMRRLTFLPP
ncbi:hypothetical protein M0657_010637 [Pyricularia oryzae]|uniref:BTB domain-containing protein n=1 Tax=Pyricularia oryzae (strain Y34) TaxID=1143189 RepID=A0AA97PAE5_PYRO3|nr:hypothetical protein OOU_Y34scaffold00044g4 [Pyricularia oryzae Y34]KAI7912050.1 hypothetical protein M0657_010637 [Pyricularia oryzae]